MPRRKRSQRNSHRGTPTLDLHSMKHEDVRRCCIEFIESNWGADEEAHFITGYSKRMKEIVIDLLEEYQLNFQIGDGVNNGYIISWL
jgi:hypothetical protein